MPSIQQYAVTRGTPGNVSVPTWIITGVVDQDGATVADFTGANAIRFPAVLATLSTEDQDTLVQSIANQLVLMAAAQSQGNG